tara:strand:+ start:2796 stop:3815 length:1020 start_codon:yes stop_codon:yes gene_type:complete
LQNITIIGGSGLLGRNLIKNLHKWNVTNLDKQPLNKDYQNKNYQEILGDASDEAILDQALKDADVVWIKAAKLANERHLDSAKDEYRKINTDLPKKILKKCTELNIKRIFFDSSDAVFLNTWEKNKHLPFSEHSPKDYYGKSKSEAEQAIKKWACEHKERSVQVFRYTRVASKGSLRLLSLWCIQNQLNIPLKVFGDGKRSGCMIHIEDCINANLKALQLQPNFDVYNLTLHPITLSELAKKVIMLKNKNGKFTYVKDTFSHPTDPMIHAMDPGKTWEKLSYKPRKTLNDIITEAHIFVEKELEKKIPTILKGISSLNIIKKIIRILIIKNLKKQGIEI